MSKRYLPSIGFNATGPDTTCNVILCDENEYVKDSTVSGGLQLLKFVKSCPPGTYNGPGDPLDGPATTCYEYFVIRITM